MQIKGLASRKPLWVLPVSHTLAALSLDNQLCIFQIFCKNVVQVKSSGKFTERYATYFKSLNKIFSIFLSVFKVSLSLSLSLSLFFLLN